MEPEVVKAVAKLADYGVLGIMAILLIGALMYVERQRRAERREHRAAMRDAQEKLSAESERRVQEAHDYGEAALALQREVTEGVQVIEHSCDQAERLHGAIERLIGGLAAPAGRSSRGRGSEP